MSNMQFMTLGWHKLPEAGPPPRNGRYLLTKKYSTYRETIEAEWDSVTGWEERSTTGRYPLHIEECAAWAFIPDPCGL